MVINIRSQNVFDGSKFLDGSLGLVAEGGRSDNPDIMLLTGGELDSTGGGLDSTGGEPDSGRTTT